MKQCKLHCIVILDKNHTSLSMGTCISDEIEVVTIVIDEIMILEIKVLI